MDEATEAGIAPFVICSYSEWTIVPRIIKQSSALLYIGNKLQALDSASLRPAKHLFVCLFITLSKHTSYIYTQISVICFGIENRFESWHMRVSGSSTSLPIVPAELYCKAISNSIGIWDTHSHKWILLLYTCGKRDWFVTVSYRKRFQAHSSRLTVWPPPWLLPCQ